MMRVGSYGAFYGAFLATVLGHFDLWGSIERLAKQ